MNRYSKQTRLVEVGSDGQEQLGKSRVLCVGVGGLGSPAALYLAAAGVGTIGLIDFDQVDESNLQRQILFKSSDQSQAKVVCAKTHLLELNPEIQIHVYQERFTEKNAENILSLNGESYDLVIDGSDNFETKFLVNDATYKKGIPWVYAAVNRFEGQVALFDAERGPCYRCLYPAPPKTWVENCAESGVLGSVVGTLGTLQATLALQFLISKERLNHPLRPKSGSLTLFDFAGPWSFTTVQIPKRMDCPTCSKNPKEVELKSAPGFCESLFIDQWTPEEMKEKTERPGNSIVIIDVRDLSEWRSGHMRNAIHWPLGQIENQLEQGKLSLECSEVCSEHSEIIFYCQAGIRSARAARLLKSAGIRSVGSLLGGLAGWSGHLVYD